MGVRIASLSPAATEILFRLGLGKDIVCVDQFSNFPDDAKALPHLRGHQEIDAESLRKFAPEVVITGTVIQQKLAAELQARDFAVIHQDPRTISQVYASIRQLATILDRFEEAERLVLAMQQGFNDVKKRASLFSRKCRVYVEEWHDPPMASGNWVPELLRVAGGLPFPVKDGELSRAVLLAEVIAFDPDLIVISWCGAGALAPKELLLTRQGWDAVRAVKDARIRVIDDSLLNRPGPRLVDGAQRMYSWLVEESL